MNGNDDNISMPKERNLVDLLNKDVREEEGYSSRSERVISTKKRSGFRGLFLVVSVLILVGSLSSSFYFYSKYKDAKKIEPVSVSQAEDEVKRVLAAVGALIVLPKGETPTVATVADPSQLRDQPFFANAKKGDKVLIYSDARKAILYSESQNKIVEVAPINFENPVAPSSPTSTKK